MQATNSVSQLHSSRELANVLAECLTITYNAISYAKQHGIHNRRGMKGFYKTLKEVKLPPCYKLGSITRACAVVRSRKKSENRGIANISRPKALRPVVCIVSGFFITMKGRLFIPLKRDIYFDIQLNRHVLMKLAGRKKVRSLTITTDSLSFCYSEDIEALPTTRFYGVDRNEKNITFGDRQGVTHVEMAKVVKIRETTREIVGSFKRNDARIRRGLGRKYWSRANHRTDQILHAATNLIVDSAAKNCAALAIEDLTGIGKMYRRGNGQGAEYRFRLNSWPHRKAKKMLEYKAAWNGVTIIQLTRSETYGSSSRCPTCGEKLHKPAKGDVEHKRTLRCPVCKMWMDRDVIAALNLSQRGRLRFDRSLPSQSEVKEEIRSRQVATSSASQNRMAEGLASEAVSGNGMQTPILRVDASKLAQRRELKS